MSARLSTSAERMWALVPGHARARDRRDAAQGFGNLGGPPGAGILRGLVDALGIGLDAVHDDVLRLLDDLFVDTCNPKLIPLIGDLVGVSIDPRVPEARQRHQVKYALHLRRRKGTVEQIETLGWQITGFRTRVREAPSAQRTLSDPPLSARVTGKPSDRVLSVTADVSGRVPAGKLQIEMDVARPVRRSQVELTRVGPGVHAVDPKRDLGLRRADGTPIFRRDDPSSLVGPGRPIEVELVGGDLDRLGRLVPRFMCLAGGAPVYIPHHTLAIDPEIGRVAGPTAPTPGIHAYRRYRLHFWEPLGGEAVTGFAAPQGDGVFAFAEDGRAEGLTDTHGIGLRVAYEGDRDVTPAADERLVVIREPGGPRDARRTPFVLLPPGAPLQPGPVPAQGLCLDPPGLNRFFSIEDDWGWDRFRTIRLVNEFGRDDLPDNMVEVDVERGHFRVGPAHATERFRVRFHRPYDVAAIKHRGEEALQRALPLGRSASFLFRDTAPGSTEVSRT